MTTEKKPAQLSALVKGLTASKTMEISALAARLKAEGKDIIALSAGELSCATPDSAKQAGIAAIKENRSKYTIASGMIELRQTICDKYRRELGLSYSPDQVIVCAGAKQALHEVLLSLCGTGDEVVIFTPYWVSYPEQIRLTGARVVEVQTCLEEGFIPDLERLEEALTDKTKVVMLNTPGNPTGAVYPEKVVARIAEICAERGVWLISDEIYEKIVYPPFKHVSPAQCSGVDHGRLILVNGFSKTYAMTGWRVGYALGPADVIKACGKIQGHTTSNASSIAQYAALGAMKGDESGVNEAFFGALIPELLKTRDAAVKLINETPSLKTYTPAGAYYMMINVSGLFGASAGDRKLTCASDVCKYFIEDLGVALTPGEAFGAPEYLRLSFSPAEELVIEACHRIQQGLAQLS